MSRALLITELVSVNFLRCLAVIFRAVYEERIKDIQRHRLQHNQLYAYNSRVFAEVPLGCDWQEFIEIQREVDISLAEGVYLRSLTFYCVRLSQELTNKHIWAFG